METLAGTTRFVSIRTVVTIVVAKMGISVILLLDVNKYKLNLATILSTARAAIQYFARWIMIVPMENVSIVAVTSSVGQDPCVKRDNVFALLGTAAILRI